ncbi:hypothetical protein PASE110613_07625 [Paenibacillus sediminis]|uniref:Uncharacterized protein n=1 Tax=Paenibacillus sediminis TaxID=664909 RepID=A0ABS4H3U4_9BACL|nr:hypothetical protein [Paenibacillus sediminis]
MKLNSAKVKMALVNLAIVASVVVALTSGFRLID